MTLAPLLVVTRSLTSTLPPLASCPLACLKRGQYAMTCAGVSEALPQEQVGDGNPGTFILFKKAAKPVFPVLTCTSKELSALCNPSCKRRTLASGGCGHISPQGGFLLAQRWCHFSIISFWCLFTGLFRSCEGLGTSTLLCPAGVGSDWAVVVVVVLSPICGFRRPRL